MTTDYGVALPTTFEETKTAEGDVRYYQRKKFPSGMTAEAGYYMGWDKGGKEVVIEPYLTVFHKRKKRWPDDPSQTTGRDGLEPAIWAAGCLDAMVEDIRWHFSYENHTHVRILVGWEDSRRRDIYGKFLARKGFYFDHYDGKLYLMKVVPIKASDRIAA